jgi:hypothetical protein
VALAAGFRMEGVDRARIVHNGTRRDAWRAAVLPSDWGLPQATPYLPAPEQRPPAHGRSAVTEPA